MASQPVSFLDPDVQRCPFQAYRDVREKGPVYLDESCGWYIVVGYDEIRQAALDTATFSSVTGLLLVKEGADAEEINNIYREEGVLPINTLVVSDPPLHTFHRGLVDKVFTISRVKKMQDYIKTVVSEMIDEISGLGEVEFCQKFAMKIPTYIIADQLGVSRSRFETFKRWSEAVIREGDQSNTQEQKKAITRIICELQRYLVDMVEVYRKEPADCMLSDIVHADFNGRPPSVDEIVSMVIQILVAGNDTTTNAMSSGMYRIATTPGLERRLRDDREAVGNFVEEVLRYDSPVQGLWRRVTTDTQLGGVDLPAGATVVLRFGAGNRDPGKFAEPDRMIAERANARQHMAFGVGPHFCIGNQLARAELRTAFNLLLDRLQNFRLTRGSESVEYFSHFFGYGPMRLEIAFDPADGSV